MEKQECQSCKFKSQCDAKKDPLDKQLLCNLSKIKHRVGVISGKGGVGKTTVAVNLATALATSGLSVGLLDADIHGPNVAKMLGGEGQKLHINPETNMIFPFTPDFAPNLKVISLAFLLDSPDTPVIWRGPLKHQAIKQFLAEIDWGDLDLLIVDLPPGTGDEALSVAQLTKPMDGFVIVSTPQDVAVLDAQKTVNFAKALNTKVLGIVENMSGLICPHCGKLIEVFKRGGAKKLAQKYQVPFLGEIPMEVSVAEAGDEGRPIVLDENSKSAQALKSVAQKLWEILENEG